MRATAEPVEGNKIRLSVDVDEEEIDRVLDEAISTLAKDARIPGFRPGRVPRQVLTARMGGATALRAEALREAIPDFYAQALTETETDPISPPEIDITAGVETGALSFDALVQVRPTVAIPGYAGLSVTAPSPEVTDEEIGAQVDRLREVDATLVEVTRPAADGDHVTIDIHAKALSEDGKDAVEGGPNEVLSLDDYLYEVGSGRIAEELDVQLRGAKEGQKLSFEADPQGSGTNLAFSVTLKGVREKILPELTDEWVVENSEFETVDACKAALRDQIGQAKAMTTRRAVTDAAVGALCELFEDAEVPEVLVDEELQRRVHDLEHDLARRQLGLAQFLQVIGKTSEEFVADVRTEAFRSMKADLALRSLAEAEGIEVDDEEMAAEVQRLAVALDVEPERLATEVARNGKAVALRSERRKEKALAWLLESTEVVDEDGKSIDPAAYVVPEEELVPAAAAAAPTAEAPTSGEDAE